MATDKPLSRYTTTEYNRSQRIESRIKSVYADARAFHLTHNQLLEKLQVVRDSPDHKRLTSYYRGRAAGLNDTLRENLWTYHLVWHVFYDGKLRSSKEVPDGQWNQVVCDSGQFVWADKPERLFTTPKEG